MVATTVAHHQQVHAVASSHVACLCAEWALRRDGRTKGQHVLRRNDSKASHDHSEHKQRHGRYKTTTPTPRYALLQLRPLEGTAYLTRLLERISLLSLRTRLLLWIPCWLCRL